MRMNMRSVILLAFLFIFSTHSSTAFSASCNYLSAESLMCEFELCGDTICMKCKEKGGGGTLDCKPQTASNGSTPLGGNLLENPEIVNYDFTNFSNAVSSGAQMNSANIEWFRKHIETQNSSLENFRLELEKKRINRSIELGDYKKSLNVYNEGIKNYFKGIDIVKSASE